MPWAAVEVEISSVQFALHTSYYMPNQQFHSTIYLNNLITIQLYNEMCHRTTSLPVSETAVIYNYNHLASTADPPRDLEKLSSNHAAAEGRRGLWGSSRGDGLPAPDQTPGQNDQTHQRSMRMFHMSRLY